MSKASSNSSSSSASATNNNIESIRRLQVDYINFTSAIEVSKNKSPAAIKSIVSNFFDYLSRCEGEDNKSSKNRLELLKVAAVYCRSNDLDSDPAILAVRKVCYKLGGEKEFQDAIFYINDMIESLPKKAVSVNSDASTEPLEENEMEENSNPDSSSSSYISASSTSNPLSIDEQNENAEEPSRSPVNASAQVNILRIFDDEGLGR